MRCFGIDPGFGRMGFAVLQKDGDTFLPLDYGVITTSADELFPNRLKQISDDLNELFEQHKPDMLSIETLLFSKNTTTAMRVAEARGVALLTAATHKVPVVELGPSQVKKALTGDGTADKAAIIHMVQLLLRLAAPPTPDDAADALALAIAGAVILPK